MPKLVFVIYGLNRGGAEKHLSELLPALLKKKWDIELILLSTEGPLATYLKQYPIKMTLLGVSQVSSRQSINLLSSVQLVLRLRRYFKTNYRSIEVVHFMLPQAYLLGMVALMGLKLQFKTIMSRRSLNHYQKRKPFIKTIEGYFHVKVSKILANSEAVRRQLVLEEAVPFDKIKLIYNGVLPHSPTGQHMVVDNQSMVFVVVANLISYKGHADLLQALHLVKQHLPMDWRLWIIGKDEGLQPNLEQLSETLAISHHIEWFGLRDDVSVLLNQANIGVLPSHQEGFSNALLEMMAAGLPVVATDVGGNAEAVVHLKTGLLVEAHDPQALSEALQLLASDPKLRQVYGEAGKARVASQFSLNQCVEAYHETYCALLS